MFLAVEDLGREGRRARFAGRGSTRWVGRVVGRGFIFGSRLLRGCRALFVPPGPGGLSEQKELAIDFWVAVSLPWCFCFPLSCPSG